MRSCFVNLWHRVVHIRQRYFDRASDHINSIEVYIKVTKKVYNEFIMLTCAVSVEILQR